MYPLNLAEASPQAVAGASLPYRVRLALSTTNRTTAQLAEVLNVPENLVRATISRLARAEKIREAGVDGKAELWEL